jgi:2-polyprenyl-3-methyl-5-hydroxy-6-metoxy-1,4-benzoquinol methylase
MPLGLADTDMMIGTLAMSSDKTEKHYDKVYFDTQWEGSKLGSKINKIIFKPYLDQAETVIDFGCGGGYLLNELAIKNPIGIEINTAAHEIARSLGIDVHERLETIPDEVADVIISNHALEHVSSPFEVMQELHKKLKPSGMIVITVPSDRPSLSFKDVDRDFHLYSWSANNLGNMMKATGFEVMEAKQLLLCWPPKMVHIYRIFGERGIQLLGRLFGKLPSKRSQVLAVGRKAG